MQGEIKFKGNLANANKHTTKIAFLAIIYLHCFGAWDGGILNKNGRFVREMLLHYNNRFMAPTI